MIRLDQTLSQYLPGNQNKEEKNNKRKKIYLFSNLKNESQKGTVVVSQ